jgi:chromate transporter
MLDGLGMAETTPGPLIMVVQFVGFLAAFRDPGSLDPYVAAVLASVLVTWVTFTPSFLWIFLGAPYIERLRGNRAFAGALSAITAAVVGVILNLAIWFALHVIFTDLVSLRAYGLHLDVPVLRSVDLAALILFIGAMVATFRFRVGVLPLLAGCALLGCAWRLFGL